MSNIGQQTNINNSIDNWIQGGDGICLFHSDNEKFSITSSLPNNPPTTDTTTSTTTNPSTKHSTQAAYKEEWSEDIGLQAISANKILLELVDKV